MSSYLTQSEKRYTRINEDARVFPRGASLQGHYMSLSIGTLAICFGFILALTLAASCRSFCTPCNSVNSKSSQRMPPMGAVIDNPMAI